MVALFVSFFYDYAEGLPVNDEYLINKPPDEKKEKNSLHFKYCSFNPYDCKEYKHCYLANEFECKRNNKIFKKMVSNCELPTTFLCAEYNHCDLKEVGKNYLKCIKK